MAVATGATRAGFLQPIQTGGRCAGEMPEPFTFFQMTSENLM